MSRERFSSPLATVLTMVGVAVGLGNVWRFPYMMGLYGGSAFLVVYLGFVLLLGIPLVMAEWALGRETRCGPLGAFGVALGRPGRVMGALLVLNVVVANSYYLVIIARLLHTAGFSVLHGFHESTHEAYHAAQAQGGLQYLLGVILLFLILVVLDRGLVQGVERLSRLFVPLFGVVVLYMIVHSLTLPGVFHRLGEFLRPDFGRMGPVQIFAALGQAFFSLSVGGTFFVIYGSYLRDDENIPRSATLTAAGDVSASVLAALFVVPTVLVLGLDLASGPGLIFDTFPHLFSAMPGGRVVGSSFLLAFTLVAFLSSLAAVQVSLGTLQEASDVSRRKALVLVGLVQAALMAPSAFDESLIQKLDLICGSGMQCVGGGLAVIALTWGLGRERTLKQLCPRGDRRWARSLFFWLRWGAPLGLLLAFLHFLLGVLTAG